MSKKHVLKLSALAVAIATAAPMVATAEVTGSLDIASQYLWRGVTLFNGGTVSGSLDYGHESGLYAGVWASSESEKGEYDLYAGFAGEAGDFSYDIGAVNYRYSGDGTGVVGDCNEFRAQDCNFTEGYLSVGFMGFGASAYIGVDEYGTGADNKDNYYSVSYEYEKFSGVVGMYDYDASASNYTHVDLRYAVTDNLSFTGSQIVDQKVAGTYREDLKVVVAYSFPF